MLDRIVKTFSSKAVLAFGGLATGAALMLGASSAFAQAKGVVEAANMQGPDRQQKLVAAAKKEGELMIYTSAPVDDMTVLTNAFEQKYGIKAKIWRAGSEKVLQRAVMEAKGRRYDADIVETNGPELEALHREKLFQEVKSPYLADLIPQAILPHKEWIATRLNIFSLAYNTNKVKKEDVPKTYQDLLDPKWKGRLGIEAEDADWFAGTIMEMGEQKGLKLFRDIVATNGLSVRKGHTLLANLVASGEVPLALTTYNYKVEQLKNKGAPVDWAVIPPAMARPNGIGMMKNSQHPNAAVLFIDFVLSDGQEILLKRDFVPTSKKVDTKLNKIPLKFIDPKVILDENEKWTKLYEEIITRQSK
ncbi:iron(III) transport system substrate-binding protein [Noviherbaspirillum humi]|uniref:Iron(III) transport system substrate-binding protein n=1 Tax=Noviherbaspirillum humi TaxID=1688639 RepID=A0A239IKL0_9BURK|nr:extracellular solute-binding protein [Noviherbaspirillum humi]SNS94079.1 iron(III) transport system substrate-binding protein [Noviherbaspirillum humi]